MEKDVQLMSPQNTWFFEDSTGRVFPANEKEAFNLLTENSRWRRQDIKMIGMSDSKEYYRIISEAGPKGRELEEQIKKLKETLNKFIQGHDRLLFDEFAEETDPRLVRAKKLIKETEDKIELLEIELKELRSGLIDRALKVEIERARGNMVLPRDFSVIKKGEGAKLDSELQAFANSKKAL